MTQDCLEILFSVVCLKKPAPSAYDFKCSLRLICTGQLVHTRKTSGYAIDDRGFIADLFWGAASAPSEEAPTGDIMDDMLNMITKEECDMLA